MTTNADETRYCVIYTQPGCVNNPFIVCIFLPASLSIQRIVDSETRILHKLISVHVMMFK
jgi:hypothetical protein